ncbi:MAG TPA: serine protease [Kineosporiaceae bacterium]|nr:serine protease [Kineosporiaceae bacterium]
MTRSARRRARALLLALVAATTALAAVPAAAVVDTAPAGARGAGPTVGSRGPGRVTPFVTGGRVSRSNAYPWLVALSVDGRFRCGGELVDPSWVLTAGHCVPAAASRLSLLVGQSDRASGTGGERRGAAAVVRHPRFARGTGGSLLFDVALVQLDSPSTKQPLQIATALERHLWDAGRRVRALGWGATSERGAPVPQLREVDVPVQPDRIMSQSYGHRFRPDVMLGAGLTTGGLDTCAGDSGGPLVAAVNGSWRLVGLTSWGDGCGRAGKPGVYARVAGDPLVTFIRTTIFDAAGDD